MRKRRPPPQQHIRPDTERHHRIFTTKETAVRGDLTLGTLRKRLRMGQVSMTKKKQQEYQASKFHPIVQVVARLLQQHPDMAENMDYLWTNVTMAIPELRDRTHCGNCGESMATYKYT